MLITATVQQTPFKSIPTFDATIVVSSVLTVSVAAFAAKWMFGQIVSYWHEQVRELKKNFEKLDLSIADLAARDEEIRSELVKFKCDIAQEYVTREDWIRSAVGLENKIERLGLRMDDKFDRILEKLGSGK